MQRCARCGRLMFSSVMINGYCAACAELTRRETEHKSRIEEQARQAGEIKRMNEERVKQLTAGMENFIAEQNTSAVENSDRSDACNGPAADVQAQMTEEDFEKTALCCFPEKAEDILREIDDTKGFAYGYLELLSITLNSLLDEWTNHALIWKYCRFLELIWQKGDSYMKTALCVTAIESLYCNGGDTNWLRFGYYLSESFRTWINTEAVPGNIILSYGNTTPRLTSLHGVDLPGSIQPVITGNSAGFPAHADDPFMLGDYHIIAGRLERFDNHPERLSREFRDLKWTNADSSYHCLIFENEKGREDSFQIIISHFNTGFLQTNIAEAFFHTVLIAHRLTGMPGMKSNSETVHFRCSEEEWNRIPAEQRCADAAAMMEKHYKSGSIFYSNVISNNPESGLPELAGLNDYRQENPEAYQKLITLLYPLPSNMYQVRGDSMDGVTTETILGTRDDSFITVFWQCCG